jgi:hypothetical protein
MWSDKVTDEQCNLKSDYYISYWMIKYN